MLQDNKTGNGQGLKHSSQFTRRTPAYRQVNASPAQFIEQNTTPSPPVGFTPNEIDEYIYIRRLKSRPWDISQAASEIDPTLRVLG